MRQTLARKLTLAALVALPLLGARPAAAWQTVSKDDALDKLLKKVEEKEKSKETPAKPGSDETNPTKPGTPSDETNPIKPGTKTDETKPANPGSDVSSKDKALDSLLEKLGASEDKASPDDKKAGGGPGAPMPDDAPPPDKPGDEKNQKKPDELTGKSKKLDEHLEEITGKRRKKKDNDGADGGPMSEVIKQMREVERRLGKPDTGEETRKEQTQIVKKLETLIEQARSSSSQSRNKQRRTRPGNQNGQQPGDPSDQPGNTGGNAPFTKANKPNNRRSLAGGKDEWGHLPPELRQEMDNVFKEDPLPSREELIKRYYLSVSEKKLARGR